MHMQVFHIWLVKISYLLLSIARRQVFFSVFCLYIEEGSLS